VPTIMIYQSPRPVELKRAAAAALTSAIAEIYDLLPEQIHVYFHESDDDSCAKGGRLASDRDGEPARSGDPS
jgi:phenylpyruvate tautomerase PptA (4-oxalocrotonate tautomerase family)